MLRRPARILPLLALSGLSLVQAGGCVSSPGRSEDGRPSPPPAATAPAVGASPAPAPLRVRLPGGIEVNYALKEVVVPAEVSLESGWLEQVVCRRGTRDHEAVLVVDVAPSQVQAALLMIELVPGEPGRWIFEEVPGSDRPVVRRVEPRGDRVSVSVRWGEGEALRERPVADWITDIDGGDFPSSPWVFGGSFFDRVAPEAPEFFAADASGSLVGLVTFGDEVLGLERIRSDQVGVDAAEWMVRTGVVPPPGTPVQLVFRPWRDG